MTSQFFRILATLTSAGIPIHVALREQESVAQEAQSEVYGRVATLVESGRPLSKAMSFTGSPFSKFQLGLIQVAESTGSLVAVLSRLADYEERENELKSRLRSQLAYPAFLMVVAFLASLLLPPFVLKDLLKMLVEMRIDLPLSTRILIALSDLTTSPWFLFVVVGLGVGLFKFWPSWKRNLFQVSRNLPYWSTLLRDLATIRFSEAMAVQCEAGVPLPEAVDRALTATGQSWIAAESDTVQARLSQGDLLSESLESLDFATPTFLHMINSSEESGRFSFAFRWLADYYHQRLDCSMNVLSTVLEPVIMTVLGALFAFMAMASLLPLTRLVEAL